MHPVIDLFIVFCHLGEGAVDEGRGLGLWDKDEGSIISRNCSEEIGKGTWVVENDA